MQLEGCVCVLTGASGGIGRALAAELAARGVRLILSGRDVEALDRLRSDLPAGSVSAVYAGDLTTAHAREVLAELAGAWEADILVNLSGCNRFGLFTEHAEHDIVDLIDSNLTAPIALTRRLLPHLTRRPEAMIVNVGSAFGSIGFPGYVLYSASKFGLRGFSEALARELADGTVRVIHIAPRATATTMNPPVASTMNRALGNGEDPPERVAAKIVEAIQRGARHTGIGWRERLFARINQTWPGLVDRAIARQLATIKQFAAKASQEEPIP